MRDFQATKSFGRFGSFACALALAACGSESDPDMAGACAAQRAIETSDGFEAVVCEELHATAPHVRLPDAGDDRVFGQIVRGEFQDENGTSYAIGGGGDVEESESDRHGTAVYLADVDGRAVSNLRPLLLIEEKHFLGALLGRSFEGRMSRRVSVEDPGYALEASLPVRVEFAVGSEPRSADGQAVLSAALLNLDRGVTGADGSCLPALASYGDEAPFGAGSSVELEAFRVAAMHLFDDDVFVVDWLVNGESVGNVMGIDWYATPFDVMRGLAPPTTTYTGIGHGTPGYTPTLELAAEATGAGEPCGD
jgi:hypothetical protein